MIKPWNKYLYLKDIYFTISGPLKSQTNDTKVFPAEYIKGCEAEAGEGGTFALYLRITYVLSRKSLRLTHTCQIISD